MSYAEPGEFRTEFERKRAASDSASGTPLGHPTRPIASPAALCRAVEKLGGCTTVDEEVTSRYIAAFSTGN